MQKSVERWLYKYGEITLREIGIKEGQAVFDFGCGEGLYTIPAARIVGEEGSVYALDKDKGRLVKLMQTADAFKLQNISQIRTAGELEFPLDPGSIDIVLLYDIFWYFSTNDPRLLKLLNNIQDILKPGGLLSVYPKHVDAALLEHIIENSGFSLNNIFDGLFIHEKSINRDQAFNFLVN